MNETCARLDERGLLAGVADVVLAHHVTMFDACSRSRTQLVVVARHAAWAHLRALGFSYPEIGMLWDVDHSTVLQALTKNQLRARRKKRERAQTAAAAAPPPTPGK